MSLEQMKKEDLVRELRTTQQTNKDLEVEIKELKTKIKDLEEDKTNNGNKIEVSLPYKGVSLLKDKKRKRSSLVRIQFDLKGNCKVDMKEFTQDHTAYFNAEKVLNEELIRQDLKEDEV